MFVCDGMLRFISNCTAHLYLCDMHEVVCVTSINTRNLSSPVLCHRSAPDLVFEDHRSLSLSACTDSTNMMRKTIIDDKPSAKYFIWHVTVRSYLKAVY